MTETGGLNRRRKRQKKGAEGGRAPIPAKQGKIMKRKKLEGEAKRTKNALGGGKRKTGK